MGTGPKDASAFGERYQQHSSLGNVTMFLENYPRKGEKIILTALNSPVTSNRFVAISVLDKWKQENWSPEVDSVVRQLLAIEPNQDVRDNIKRLLSGAALQ